MVITHYRQGHVRTAAVSEPPRFESAEHWRRHYDDATKHRHRPWPPTTRDELSPLPERFKERFLETLNSDHEFASAALNLIDVEG